MNAPGLMFAALLNILFCAERIRCAETTNDQLPKTAQSGREPRKETLK